MDVAKLTRLADLAFLERYQKSPWAPQALSSDALWTSRWPVLLPPSPIPGNHPYNKTTSPSKVFPRSRFALCANKNGDVYFYGGSKPSADDVLYHYSIKDNTVTPLECWGASPGGLNRHAMTLVGNLIAVHGGQHKLGGGSLFLLDLVSRQWSKIATRDNPGDLKRHSMVAIHTTIYIFGGYKKFTRPTDELWAFDLNSLRTEPTWVLIKPSSQRRPYRRSKHALVPNGNQLILIGGWNGKNYMGDVWSFDVNSKRWSKLQCTGEFFEPRKGHAAAVLDDVVYVIGGYTKNGVSNDVFALKISERRWLKLTGTNTTPIPRYNHAAICMGTAIFVFGGSLDIGAKEQSPIHILDAYNVNNPYLHTDERLMQLDTEFPDLRVSDVKALVVKHEEALAANLNLQTREKELEAQLRREERKVEVFRVAKGEIMAENSRLKNRLKELEREISGLRSTQIILSILDSQSKMDLISQQWGTNAQTVADFLAEVLERRDILQSNTDRRRILHLLSKLAKSAQVFPKCTELSGVQCDLTVPVNDEGGHGFIYKGVFREQEICVKAVRVYDSGSRANRVLRAQAGELVVLAHVFHPNVIPLYGAFLSNEARPRICIVTPWMENGNLAEYLEKFPDISRSLLVSDVATGLEFLHDMGIVHADLKARNVLISQSRRAILADLGVSTVLKSNVGTTTAHDFCGTDYWMAPELYLEQSEHSATQHSDMWALGCICFEVLTGKVPFVEYYHPPRRLIAAFIKGRDSRHKITPLRPQRDRTITIVNGGPLVKLAEKCWNWDPIQRPTATEARQFLAGEVDEQDDRPSLEEEVSMFETARNLRTEPKIDYSHVLSILRNV